ALRKLANRFARLRVPAVKRAFPASGKYPAAVGREGHALHLLRVPLVATHFLAGLDVPQAHRLVPTARENAPAVGGEGHDPDRLCVPLEAFLFLAGLEIPQAKGLIRAGGDGTAT